MKSEIDFFKIETNNIAPQKGRILVAEPFLNDIYFKRSIVYLTEHNNEGSIGFVLNKPVNLQISEVINDFPEFECDISIGGPVSTNTVHYIHTLGEIIPNSVNVGEGIYWGGDFDTLKQLIKEKALIKKQVRFFLGYSGWVPKQLDDELAQNSWLVSAMDATTIMNGNMNEIWQQVLNNLGGRYRMWINSPENPNLN
jgi:putative transcriptional regulator